VKDSLQNNRTNRIKNNANFYEIPASVVTEMDADMAHMIQNGRLRPCREHIAAFEVAWLRRYGHAQAAAKAMSVARQVEVAMKISGAPMQPLPLFSTIH
jgi:hypothetical protein